MKKKEPHGHLQETTVGKPITKDESDEDDIEEKQDLKQDDPTKWELTKSNF